RQSPWPCPSWSNGPPVPASSSPCLHACPVSGRPPKPCHHPAVIVARRQAPGFCAASSFLASVSVHGSMGTSVQRDIEPRTRRGHGFAVEWPKDGGRSHQEPGAAFKWGIPALISS